MLWTYECFLKYEYVLKLGQISLNTSMAISMKTRDSGQQLQNWLVYKDIEQPKKGNNSESETARFIKENYFVSIGRKHGREQKNVLISKILDKSSSNNKVRYMKNKLTSK